MSSDFVSRPRDNNPILGAVAGLSGIVGNVTGDDRPVVVLVVQLDAPFEECVSVLDQVRQSPEITIPFGSGRIIEGWLAKDAKAASDGAAVRLLNLLYKWLLGTTNVTDEPGRQNDQPQETGPMAVSVPSNCSE